MKGLRHDAAGKAGDTIPVLDLCNALGRGHGDDVGGRFDVYADGQEPV